MASLARSSLEDGVRSCDLARGCGSEGLCSEVVERKRMGSKYDCHDWQKSGCGRLLTLLDLTDSKSDLGMHSGPVVGCSR